MFNQRSLKIKFNKELVILNTITNTTHKQLTTKTIQTTQYTTKVAKFHRSLPKKKKTDI
ncbi:hypothetical protein TXIAM_220184 [Tenacibaculum xiamenense]